LSWRLESLTGRDWATAIVAVVLAAVFAVIMATQRGARPFVVTALLTGFVFCVVSTILTPWVTVSPVTIQRESAARYTALPIFLIEAAVIVGVDYALRNGRGVRERLVLGHWYARAGLRPSLAVLALIVILATSWAADFRYKGIRTVPYSSRWSVTVNLFRTGCVNSPFGKVIVYSPTGESPQQGHPAFATIPCARMRL
jgi:hypothetical protein